MINLYGWWSSELLNIVSTKPGKKSWIHIIITVDLTKQTYTDYE